jgi:hypothetical protein
MGALDDLREAAKTLRERAEAATRGPWLRAADHSLARGQYADNDLGWWDGEYAAPVGSTGDGDEATADARYIATVHPGVGLALADWLDKAAEAWPLDLAAPPRDPRDRAMLYEALAVARLILGRADGK